MECVASTLHTTSKLGVSSITTADAHSGFGGLEVACWSLVPKFAGSHPAKAVGFLGREKSSARLPSEGK